MSLLGPETGLEFRPISKADLDQWYQLVLRIYAVEKAPWHDQIEDLENVLTSDKNDPRLDTLLGVDSTGAARAYAQVQKNPAGEKAYVFGGVDPLWQRRGIGSALLRWQEARAAQRFAEQGQSPALARVYAEEHNAAERALYTSAGFRIVRYFSEMRRPLTDEIPVVELGPGLVVVPFSEQYSEAVRLAHNEAFADHWGSEPRDEQSWRNTVEHPFLRPDWSALVLDETNGEVAGYQLSSYDTDIVASEGRHEGYTELLGVRRAYRGRRVAAALLADVFAKFRAAGMDVAALEVDTESPTGADGLYQRMGYRPVRRSMAYDKQL